MDSNENSLIKPTRRERIYDVVKDAGIDVSAWHKGKGDFASNPNFCYRWAFEGEHSVVLCLWLRSINLVDGEWVCIGNARREQLEREAQGSDHWDPAVRNRTKRWANSAYQMDEVIKQAFRKKLEVRVCIVDSKGSSSELEASSADYRILDASVWALRYDMLTGDYQVTRGVRAGTSPTPDESSPAELEKHPAPLARPEITATSYGVGVVDQFIQDPGLSDPVLGPKYERERSAEVRQLVMVRSEGRCEWCNEPGFKKHDGQIYLESHHVVPLCEDGADSITNVIALCPNDHRRAHYGEGRADMADKMLVRVQERIANFRL
ncbi:MULTISPECIES: HNH endonuclease signature motif containing protein [Pseudomonas chlororaphis group]|uniref:HNH endonuclease n=1 Tax=Pseudomonas chlororaphis group TaxID=136842 RepID=UPI0020971D6E|nr:MULTISPECIES: HNH endonuclease signature motif containing protein [Pseudomonas chlororaphis group]MCO7577806.1 HNH endonuclease [Pseudomonas protegens]MCO7584181.1 HNH endonuclease [Pseudomonas chlororaphis]MCO7601189.1 HNH endonuclease [Pseudomonas chlororaphis]